MFGKIIKSILGTKTDRDVKRFTPIVQAIRRHEKDFAKKSDDQLREVTAEFRARLEDGEDLNAIMAEAFGAVCAACRKLRGKSWQAAGNTIEWDMVPFDVQLMGGMSLHEGKIAEMATGEGKTLVAVAPLYLNALEGKGAHLVTVNDYLAKRDAEWMGPVYESLGMTVGKILTDLSFDERRKSYRCDITYGTNNEFGFDYLRDNMATSRHELVQRGFHYAIVDEVDSVLIDEARTPLIIAGPIESDMREFISMKPLVEKLHKAQTALANKLMGEAEDIMKRLDDGGSLSKQERDDLEYEAGLKLLQAEKGQPKNNKLMKAMQEVSNIKRKEKTERLVMLDKKMREVEEELYFVLDEKGHAIDLTDKGRATISPNNPEMFVLTDIVDEFAKIEADHKLSVDDKNKAKEKVRVEHEARQRQLHSISQLLRAYTLYIKDVEYVVSEDGKVVIVDEHTGRQMPGRRWSDGLHSAVEAKEGVKVEQETVTMATVTLQNFFRMYKKLAGMTGTAETEAAEFSHTYGMETAVIPTNKPMTRQDLDDVVYRTRREKFTALLDEIEALHKEGLPVLVGTRTVEVSELVSKMLLRRKISHNVLNAKHHQKEAEIIREAGKAGQVTIATNMAGRGTDIKLGQGVVREGDGGAKDGGLQIIGTERHDSRRIDRQLRGRAGRQGDPGSSRFFLSLEDDLMRLFGSDRIGGLMQRLGMEDGEPISHPWVTKAIESAQKKVENRNFEIRKRLLDYDNVVNKQRTAVYSMRREVLMAENLNPIRDTILDMSLGAIEAIFPDFGDPNGSSTTWNMEGLRHYIARYCPYADVADLEAPQPSEKAYDELFEDINERLEEAFDLKTKTLGDVLMMELARVIVLRVIDRDWRDHLSAMDDLRENIWTASYAQKEPLVEYQREAGVMFNDLLANVNKEVFQHLFLAQIVVPQAMMPKGAQTHKQEAGSVLSAMARQQAPQQPAAHAAQDGMIPEDGRMGMMPPQQHRHQQPQAPPPGHRHAPASAATQTAEESEPRPKAQPVRREEPKIGRNDPCHCGSGKKFKNCHGK